MTDECFNPLCQQTVHCQCWLICTRRGLRCARAHQRTVEFQLFQSAFHNTAESPLAKSDRTAPFSPQSARQDCFGN